MAATTLSIPTEHTVGFVMLPQPNELIEEPSLPAELTGGQQVEGRGGRDGRAPDDTCRPGAGLDLRQRAHGRIGRLVAGSGRSTDLARLAL